jgi:hypothetical protein
MNDIFLFTTPFTRAIVASATISLVLLAVKPSSMFDADGKERPWSVIAGAEKGTLVPLWLVATGVFLGVGFFI